MSCQVLVLDGFDQVEFRDGSVSDGSNDSHKQVLVSSVVTHNVHVLELRHVSSTQWLLTKSGIKRTST